MVGLELGPLNSWSSALPTSPPEPPYVDESTKHEECDWSEGYQ